MSDTPRTDAKLIKGDVIKVGDPACVGGYYAEMPDTVPADFARQLERENAELERRLAEEIKNKKQFERDWLEACNTVKRMKPYVVVLEAVLTDLPVRKEE